MTLAQFRAKRRRREFFLSLGLYAVVATALIGFVLRAAEWLSAVLIALP